MRESWYNTNVFTNEEIDTMDECVAQHDIDLASDRCESYTLKGSHVIGLCVVVFVSVIGLLGSMV